LLAVAVEIGGGWVGIEIMLLFIAAVRPRYGGDEL
jgi:hypothetical protein